MKFKQGVGLRFIVKKGETSFLPVPSRVLFYIDRLNTDSSQFYGEFSLLGVTHSRNQYLHFVVYPNPGRGKKYKIR